MPALTAELHARLVAWREAIEARIPQPNPGWRDQAGQGIESP